MNLTEQIETAADEAPGAAPVKAKRKRPRVSTSALKRTAKASLLGWRLSQQLSQREAASILGISQASYARFEVEKRYARGRLLVKRMQFVTKLPLHVIVGID